MKIGGLKMKEEFRVNPAPYERCRAKLYPKIACGSKLHRSSFSSFLMS